MSFVLGGVGLLLLLGAFLVGRLGRKDPDPNEVLLARTFSRILDGDHERVLEEMRKLYAQTNQDVGIGLALGVLLRHLGKHQVAIRTHRSLTTHTDLRPALLAQVYTELGADYLESGLLDRARTALERAIKLVPPDDLTVRHGERIYVSLKDWDAAFKLVQAHGKRKKANLSDRLGLLRYRQGEDAWQKGETDEAVAAYKKAISVHPKCVPAHLAMARQYRELGKHSKAKSWLTRHRQVFKDHEWLLMEAWRELSMAMADDQIFLEPIHERLQEAPKDWRCRIILGHFLTETGQFQEASDELLRCLEQSPQTLMIHQKIWNLMLRSDSPQFWTRYRGLLKGDLRFSNPYTCKACMYHSETILWHCPSCHRIYSFSERKI